MRTITFFFLIVLLSVFQAAAGSGAVFSDHRVIVKFKSAVTPRPAAAGARLTGFLTIDAIASRYNVREAIPAFPAAGTDRTLRTAMGMDRVFILSSPLSLDIPSVISELSKDPLVEYAEPEYLGRPAGFAAIDSVIPSDVLFSHQWSLHNTGTYPLEDPGTIGADIKAPNARAIEKGDSSIIVGVLDTGLKWDHPDIRARAWHNKGEIPGNGSDDDANGYVDDTRG